MAATITYGSSWYNRLGGGQHTQRVKISDLALNATGDGEGETHTGTAINAIDYGYINVSGMTKITVVIDNNHASLNGNFYVYVSPLRKGWPYEDPNKSTTANITSELTATHVAGEWINIPYDPDGNAYVTVNSGAMGYFIVQGPFESLKIRAVSSGTAITAGINAYIIGTYDG